MKNGSTLLVFIMDRSGSMGNIITDSIGGFNSLINAQRKDSLENGNEVKVSLTIFNNVINNIYNFVDINEVKPLTEKVFYAESMTALNDAIGLTVNLVGKQLSNLPEEERPEKVLVTIITDGEENSSREFTNNDVKELVKHQETVYNWTFNFIGANIDSFGEGKTRGINTNNTANYVATPVGVSSMFEGLSNYTLSYRGVSGPSGPKRINGEDISLSSFIK